MSSGHCSTNIQIINLSITQIMNYSLKTMVDSSLLQKLIPLFLAALLLNSAHLFAQVTMSEESWTLPTYEVLEPEKAPIFFRNGNFQGAQRVIYPYAANDVLSKTKVSKDWKALILENEYIKLCVTPEIGGKLYYATDKTNGYNFIYKNNEVKPANIGMLGAWVSGGIEWCVLHHHRASTFLPMDYSLSENEDGSKTIYIGETEPRHRMRWDVAISLNPGKAYFEAKVSIYNPTPYTHNFLYWANVATHTNESYQTIFPPSVEFATYHQKNQFTRWPISTETYLGQDYSEGVDISYWKNVRNSASFFAHDLKEDFMGGYDHGNQSGTVHIGDHNIVKGAKLWEWGSGPRGQSTEANLTETSGPYVEIMVGAFSDNQPDYTWIRPFEVKSWKQYWYPVRDIQGFKNANLDAAVNLEQRGKNEVFLGFHSTQNLENAKVILKNGEDIILEKNIQISPAKAFTETIKIKGGIVMTDLYTELLNLDSDEIMISYQPKEKKRTEDLPDVVNPPQAPQDIETVEELYLIGSRMDQFYKTSNGGAMSYYNEVLKRDPTNIRTHTAIGNNLLKNGDYQNARKHFSIAINRLTYDYTRPSSGEALYLQGLTLKALKLYEEAVDTLYRSTWDLAYHSAAYFELAQISSIRGDYDKALSQIEEAIATNTKNSRLTGFKAALLRKTGKYDLAKDLLTQTAENDPLNFRIGNELYLVSKALNDNSGSQKELSTLSTKMRDFNQNYLELAVEYFNEGLLEEAKDVLVRYPGNDPIIEYYLGYIEDQQGNQNNAKDHFSKAEKLSEAYCFPYRLETIDVLNKALEYNPKDQKAYYYLGNILYDKQPDLAMAYWEKAVVNNPELAMAHRNLGWGYFYHEHDLDKAIASHEKSMKIDHTDAIVYTELDAMYEVNNSPVQTRLALFEGNNQYVERRDDAFVKEIKVLTLAGQPEKAVELLKDRQFSYKEGTSAVREIIMDAQLTLGIKYYDDKEYEKALEHFLLAQVPDEEAGTSRFGNREIQVNYFIGIAYEQLKNNKKAKEYFTKSVEIQSSYKDRKGRVKNVGFMDYYKGLCYLKLGNKTDADQVFNQLIESGEEQLKPKSSDPSEYFQIFGEKETENARISKAYTTRGLGFKGLGQTSKAKSDLEKALEHYVSNLWAQAELSSM